MFVCDGPNFQSRETREITNLPKPSRRSSSSVTTSTFEQHNAAQHIPPPLHRLSPPKLPQLSPTIPIQMLKSSQPRPRTLLRRPPHGDVPHPGLNPTKLCPWLRQRYGGLFHGESRPCGREGCAVLEV